MAGSPLDSVMKRCGRASILLSNLKPLKTKIALMQNQLHRISQKVVCSAHSASESPCVSREKHERKFCITPVVHILGGCSDDQFTDRCGKYPVVVVRIQYILRNCSCIWGDKPLLDISGDSIKACSDRWNSPNSE